VLKGNGPCNRERLAARRKAWEEGAWVREAAMAHAAKRATTVCLITKLLSMMANHSEFPLWEVFIRSHGGLEPTNMRRLCTHADAQMALEHARDVYTRRMEGVFYRLDPAHATTAC
jgi:hypothetical protein